MATARQIIDDHLARRDAGDALHHLAQAPIAPAGGGAPRTLPELARLATLRHVPEMYAGATTTARVQAGIDALSEAGGGTLALDGRLLDVTRTITLKPGVTLDAGWGGFRAAEGFRGAEVVRTENETIAYDSAGYARATNIEKLVVDCNRRPGLRGLHQKNVQKDRVSGLRIRNCLADGWVVEGGYELFAWNFEIVAASKRDGGVAPAPNRRGLVCAASDCHFADGVAQFFPVGVHSPGAHNHFARLHAWSTYYTDDPPMLIGFLDEGEGNTFFACSADSPRLADNASRPSRGNGGYGFYSDTHSMNKRLIGCTVQLSNYGDPATLPPKATVIPVHCGQVRNSVIGLEVRDYGSAGFADHVAAASDAVMRETTIVGGNIHEGMAVNLNLPRQDAEPFSPRLRIGGRGGGVAQTVQHGLAKRIAGMAFFEIHLELGRKGTASGPVTIEGLPDAAFGGDAGRRAAFVPVLGGWANREPVAAVLHGGSSTLRLVKQFTDAPVTDADLTDAARITIGGQYITHMLGKA